jgi:hypothetical protein
MWGQIWGQMLWSGGRAVPALGFWSTLALGAVLGAAGARLLRRPRPRALGALVVALAVLVPITARAISLITFTNGTVADANQVNANFAALTPVTGFNEVLVSGTVGNVQDVFAPAFVAPRALTCTVSIESALGVTAISPSGDAFVRAAMNQNGSISYALAPPANVIVPAGYLLNSASNLIAAQTRQFSVATGATVAFGCELHADGDFAAAINQLCTVVYSCV